MPVGPPAAPCGPRTPARSSPPPRSVSSAEQAPSPSLASAFFIFHRCFPLKKPTHSAKSGKTLPLWGSHHEVGLHKVPQKSPQLNELQAIEGADQKPVSSRGWKVTWKAVELGRGRPHRAPEAVPINWFSGDAEPHLPSPARPPPILCGVSQKPLEAEKVSEETSHRDRRDCLIKRSHA